MSRNESLVSASGQSSFGEFDMQRTPSNRPVTMMCGIDGWPDENFDLSHPSPTSPPWPEARPSTLTQVFENVLDFGELPEALLQRTTTKAPLTSLGILLPLHLSPHFPSHDLTYGHSPTSVVTSFGSNITDYHQWPTSPSTTGLIHRSPPISGNLSRQLSTAIGGAIDGISMMRFNSSQAGRPYQEAEANVHDYDASGGPCGGITQDLYDLVAYDCLDDMAGFTSLSTASEAGTNTVRDFSISPPEPESQAMQRDDSLASTTSSTSAESAQRRRKKQLVNAQRPIKPKAIEHQAEPAKAGPHKGQRPPNGRVAITKVPSTRRPRNPLKCARCGVKSKSFVGDGELHRHEAREHATHKKRWICVDASPQKNVLTECSKCESGKTYGMDYNCAAHLRRTHFHPCPKGHGKRGQSTEKRGGSGGGNHPSLDDLKKDGWIVEILVPGQTTGSSRSRASDGGDQLEAGGEIDALALGEQGSLTTDMEPNASSASLYDANDPNLGGPSLIHEIGNSNIDNATRVDVDPLPPLSPPPSRSPSAGSHSTSHSTSQVMLGGGIIADFDERELIVTDQGLSHPSLIVPSLLPYRDVVSESSFVDDFPACPELNYVDQSGGAAHHSHSAFDAHQRSDCPLCIQSLFMF